ncbi:hypothetical protein [Pedobacter panaciterrae]
MLNTRLKYLFICLIGSCVVMLFLQLFSIWKQSQPNGFIRLFPSNKIIGKEYLNLKLRNWYFAGIDSSGLYLGNWGRPGILSKITSKATEISDFKISGYENVGFYEGAYLRTEGTDLFLLDGVKALIGKGSLIAGKLKKTESVPYFTLGLPISSNNYILRTVKGMQSYLIATANNKLSVPLKFDGQKEGIFSTDGSLLKAPRANRVFYVYSYCNQFLALDTNLNILYKAHTKDTISKVQITVSKVASEHKITMSAPPMVVNKQCAINDEFLFINSGMRADNETLTMNKLGSPIDVYNVSNGKYKFSFYLPNFDGKKLTDFRVYGQSLYVLYDHYLYKYQLNF